MKKRYLVLITAVFAMGITTGVAAETNIKDITAKINYAINFKLNGNEFIPVDDKGKTLSPIVYDGTTYLPVRAVSQAFGVAVDWDNDNSTVLIGEKEGQGRKLYDFKVGGASAVVSKDSDMLSLHQQKVDEGIYGLKLSKIIPQTVNFKLDKKFQKLTLKVGALGEPATVLLVDQKTNVELKRITIAESDKFKEFEIPSLAGVDYLDLKIYGSESYKTTKVVITDAYLK